MLSVIVLEMSFFMFIASVIGRWSRKVSFLSVALTGEGKMGFSDGRKKVSAPGSVRLAFGSQMPLALPLSALCFVETGNSLGTRAPCIPILPGLGSPPDALSEPALKASSTLGLPPRSLPRC